MNFLSSAQRRQARMLVSEDTTLVSPRTYNLVLCGTVLFGLVVNILMCMFCADFAMHLNPLALIIGYLVLAICGTILAYRSRVPLVSFIGYCLVVIPLGLVVSVVVASYGGVDEPIVQYAFLLTGIITLVMTVMAFAFPWFFSGIGQFLLTTLIAALVCEVICLLFGIRQYATTWIIAGIFSLYIGFDVYRSQCFPKTVDNAIDCALDIYLDIVNLFLRILAATGRSGGSSSGGSGRK